MIKKAIVLVVVFASLSGCVDLDILMGNPKLEGTWKQDGTKPYQIRFQEDNTGIALNDQTNDYFFTWRLDSDDKGVMYWEIDGKPTRVVYFTLLHNDNVLVLVWEGNPTVYKRV